MRSKNATARDIFNEIRVALDGVQNRVRVLRLSHVAIPANHSGRPLEPLWVGRYGAINRGIQTLITVTVRTALDRKARNIRVTSVNRIGHVEYGDRRNGMGRGAIGVGW